MALIKINWNPPPRELRLFAALWLPLFALVIGVIISYRFDLRTAAIGVWAVGGGLAVLSLISLRLARSVYVALVCLSFPIGWVVSHVAMLVIYFLVLSPIGLGLRLVGYDPMNRQLEANSETYWQKRDPEREAASYFRQF